MGRTINVLSLSGINTEKYKGQSTNAIMGNASWRDSQIITKLCHKSKEHPGITQRLILNHGNSAW